MKVFIMITYLQAVTTRLRNIIDVNTCYIESLDRALLTINIH